MSSQHPDRAPERLIHGKFGPLLREANRQLEAQIDEPAAFERISERLAASRRRRLSASLRWLVPASPFAVAALAAALLIAHQQKSNVVTELAAERWSPPTGVRAEPTTAASAAGDEATPLETAPKKDARPLKRSPTVTPSRPSLDVSATPAPSTTEPALRAEPPEPPSAEPVPTSISKESAAGPDCLGLARQGQTRSAEACFLERAKGSGLAAEMALYEVARLRRDVLADADGALRALAEYRSRFPAGSLRREADMSQLQLLLQLGRSDAALKQSDELLSSSASGERATELRLLRGHVLRKQSRFAEAAREYELADGTARVSDATYFRALCLEALGRTSDAASSFAKYLEQPQRPYADDARRRLERLKP